MNAVGHSGSVSKQGAVFRSKPLAVLKAFLVAIGVNPINTLRWALRLPWYFREALRFRKDLQRDCEWALTYRPVLSDCNADAGELGEYFWQDLFVAKRILEMNPQRHIDVGSRIDGFISNLACSRPVEVFDIRPLSLKIPNVQFTQCDMSQAGIAPRGICDSLSCLHTIEHVGLGRYGDPLDQNGWKAFFSNLSTLLQADGRLWLSTPVGTQRVEFNAHRVFNPWTIKRQGEALGLQLIEFHYLSQNQVLKSVNIEADMTRLGRESYTLGLFLFQKLSR